MKLRIISILTILAASLCLHAVESSPVGAILIECKGKSDTYVSVNFTRTPVFAGIVGEVNSVAGTVKSLHSADWSVNKFVYASGKDRYYVKFKNGALAGEWFDIKSNTADTVEMRAEVSDIAQVKVGDEFEIIPYWTLNTLFPNGNGLDKSTGQTAMQGATLVYKYTIFKDGQLQINKGLNVPPLMTYYYYDRGGYAGWMSSKSVDIDSNDVVIEPNAVLQIRQQNAESINIPIVGSLPMCVTSIKIATEADSQDYHIAMPSSVSFTLSDLADSLADSGVLQVSKAGETNDILYVYDNTKLTYNPTPSATYFYFSTVDYKGWFDFKGNPADDVVLNPSSAFVLRKKKTNLAGEVLKGKYIPSYVQ